MTHQQNISRRDLLRGVGTALALPWMESFTAAGPVKAGAKTLNAPPLRTAFLFMPNGVVPENWTPKGDHATDWEFRPMIQSLAPHRDDILLLENLWHRETDGRNGHWPKVPAWLAGGYVERGSGADLDTGGTSADQLMARHIGHQTVLPSFELGLDSPRVGIDNVGGGFPRILGSYISWQDPHTPVPKEILPQMAFDRLFRTGNAFPKVRGMGPDDPRIAQSLQHDDISVLDLVLEDSQRIRRRISRRDREKLDEYLESVRAVEKRIRATIVPAARWQNDNQFQLDRPSPGVPDSHTEHVRLMLDILLLAFWTDTTRICTFMFGDAQSGKVFDFLDGVGKSSFHGISHHRNDKARMAEYEKIGTWHVEQFAWLLKKMKALQEGEHGSLLDHCQLLFGSSLRDGNRHDPHNLPLVLAGRANGKLKPGRRLRAGRDTPMCNLLVSMMQNMFVDVQQFGDSTGALKGLGG